MKVIVGKKLGMSSIFSVAGEMVPVTVIEVEPNLIIEVKDQVDPKYKVLVVGYQDTRENLLTKPVLGQFKKRNLPVKKNICELKNVDASNFKSGDFLNLTDTFQVGNFVDVQGITKGHGFTGAIKLWNFAIGPKSHGAGYPHRYQGSLETGRGGASAQKVWKGKKMSGRYGNALVTICNLEILYIDADKNLVFIKGAVPGRKNRFVKIKTTSRVKKNNPTPFEILKKQSIEITSGENTEILTDEKN